MHGGGGWQGTGGKTVVSSMWGMGAGRRNGGVWMGRGRVRGGGRGWKEGRMIVNRQNVGGGRAEATEGAGRGDGRGKVVGRQWEGSGKAVGR